MEAYDPGTAAPCAYPRPIEWIKQIEFSSRCNLACHYCPHSKMPRPKLDMSMATFERTLLWLTHFRDAGTQGELSLQGIGESTLHPDFIPMMQGVREVLPDHYILFSTNGLVLDEEMVQAAALFHIRIDVSLHRPERAVYAVELAKKYGVLGVAGSAAATTPVDWAGQVDHPLGVPRYPCPWLRKGGVSIMATGKITTCCFDTDESGVIGDVAADPAIPILTQPWHLCATCHQIP